MAWSRRYLCCAFFTKFKFWINEHRSMEDFIRKKEGTLNQSEIECFVKYATELGKKREQVSKYEDNIGKMLSSIKKNKLNDDETSHLTRAMVNSGETLRWPPEWKNIVVDKHSTGGVGDKVSLVLAPVLAACGLKVPMISGRALEHTGGTLDKLESIPGFTVEQNKENMKKILTDVGCCIVSQSKDLAPADKILYEIRDKTKTVHELGLITASIISKKAVESLYTLVLDVKFGIGAFCKEWEDAEVLAIKMVRAGHGFEVKTIAMLTDMNSPLGKKVGDALEVAESIQCLQGKGPQDLTDLVKVIAGQLLVSATSISPEEADKLIDETLNDHISDRSALVKFKKMMIAQGVDQNDANELCDENEDPFKILLSKSKGTIEETEIEANTSGYVHGINALTCGNVTKELRSSENGHTVGLELFVSVGDKIKEGVPWVKVYHHGNFQEKLSKELRDAIEIKTDPIKDDKQDQQGKVEFDKRKPNKRAVCKLEEIDGKIKKTML